jgi:hypothetical protein
MAAAAADLQTAICSVLIADPALVAVLGAPYLYESPPKNVVYPYVTFAGTSVYDWSTGTAIDTEQLFTLHVWSKSNGDVEALGIMVLIRVRLADRLVPVGGRDPVRLALEFFELRYDDDLAMHHGLARFRALAEPQLAPDL